MLEKLKHEVLSANLELRRRGLVQWTFGNVSGVSRQDGLVVIKPSGVAYESMSAQQMVVIALESGEVVEGDLRPSSDTPTHLALYRAWPTIGGVVHTHSPCATAWAQARRDLPALGTTHADHFPGPVPCTRLMSPAEIAEGYEANTGKVIVERMAELDPRTTQAALVADHGPFTWGPDAMSAVDAADTLEYLCRVASMTLALSPDRPPMLPEQLEKHFFRKHGPGAYYGQSST